MNNPIAALPTPSTYTRLLLRRWPHEAGSLLAGTGLAAETLAHTAQISVAQQLQVFRNAMQLSGRPDWALEFGRQLDIHSHGPLGFAALSAPTLGEGLDVLSQYVAFKYAKGRKTQRVQVQLQWAKVALSHAQVVQQISCAITVRRRDRRQRLRVCGLELEGVRTQDSQRFKRTSQQAIRHAFRLRQNSPSSAIIDPTRSLRSRPPR